MRPAAPSRQSGTAPNPFAVASRRRLAPPLSREPRGAEGARAALEGQTQSLCLRPAADLESDPHDDAVNPDVELRRVDPERQGLTALADGHDLPVEPEDHARDLRA